MMKSIIMKILKWKQIEKIFKMKLREMKKSERIDIE